MLEARRNRDSLSILIGSSVNVFLVEEDIYVSWKVCVVFIERFCLLSSSHLIAFWKMFFEKLCYGLKADIFRCYYINPFYATMSSVEVNFTF